MSAATASSESSSPLQQIQTTISSLQQQQRFELYRILSVFCVLFCNLYLYQFVVLLFYFGSLILPLLLMGTSTQMFQGFLFLPKWISQPQPYHPLSQQQHQHTQNTQSELVNASSASFPISLFLPCQVNFCFKENNLFCKAPNGILLIFYAKLFYLILCIIVTYLTTLYLYIYITYLKKLL